MDASLPFPQFASKPYEVIEERLSIRNYRDQTIKAYLGQLRNFFFFILPRDPHEASNRDLEDYLRHLNSTKKSRSTIDQAINALRFLWVEVFGQKFPINELERPQKKERTPVLLTLEEVRRVALSAENLKHRLMIELAYSAGLRVSELVEVLVKDINLKTNNLFVKGQGERRKGRTTIFSRSLSDAILRQIGKKEPGDYLFPSERGGKLTTRAFAKYFKAALEISGVEKNATPHSLRHSFAAFLLQHGAKVPTVQNLMGHSRRESTNFYAKMANPDSETTKKSA
jgi:integrase/recombinase XerD